MKNNERILFLDILRIVAVSAVVLIHSVAPLIDKIDQLKIWWVANSYYSISLWSVPVMVMISGALLLNSHKNESISIFYKKRFDKVLIPTLFWGLFYMLQRGVDLKVPIILKNLLWGNVSLHLWFLYMMLGLYLLTPILRIFIKYADKSYIEYFIIIWIANIINNYMKIRYDIGIGFQMQFFTGYVGYYILGYYLANIDFDKKYKNLIYILSILAALITIFGTYILVKGKDPLIYYDYLSPNVLIMSIGIFLLFKNIMWNRYKIFNNLKINNSIIKISRLSFGIYLIHVAILPFITDLKLVTLFGPILGLILLALTTWVISLLIINIIDYLPIFKRII